jgi:hypothetical protein
MIYRNIQLRIHCYLEHWSNARSTSQHSKCPHLANLVLETALYQRRSHINLLTEGKCAWYRNCEALHRVWGKSIWIHLSAQSNQCFFVTTKETYADYIRSSQHDDHLRPLHGQIIANFHLAEMMGHSPLRIHLHDQKDWRTGESTYECKAQ